jgi:hypothetical protein
VGGDLNDTLTCADRKYSISTQKNKKPVNSLKTLIKKHKLIDIWRDMNTNLRQYTWRRNKNISTASRIDYFFINTDISLSFVLQVFFWYFDINCFIISLYSSFSRILLLSLKYPLPLLSAL